MAHCFLEPVFFDGDTWSVAFGDQFGWGGIDMPPDWRGTGVMTRLSEDRARYEDDGGTILEFLPVQDPSVRSVETAECD